MTLGAGHPMGPLALLDFVGPRRRRGHRRRRSGPPPERLRALVAEGALGRKSGRGLYGPAGPVRVLRLPFSTNVERVALAAAHKGIAIAWVDVTPTTARRWSRSAASRWCPCWTPAAATA